MTAVRTREERPVPRPLLRIFWALHRAICRATDGRLGLQRPVAGQKFGMMRLTTIGRRSGRTRLAIVGYYEDGSNLVTLAMNGWAKTNPAWWLNLQANPEATVELVGGPRRVRARVATGDERGRLWLKFADYPGWGDDRDSRATRRPWPTAVVVLEPEAVTVDADVADTRGQAAPMERSSDVLSDAATPTPTTSRRPRVRARHLLLVPGLGIALLANAQASYLGVGLVPLLVFGIGPDLPRFIGTRRPGMRTLHNATHHGVIVLAVLLGTAVTGWSPFAYAGALAWLSHVVVGWATGDRIKSSEPRTGGSLGAPATSLALATEAARSSSL